MHARSVARIIVEGGYDQNNETATYHSSALFPRNGAHRQSEYGQIFRDIRLLGNELSFMQMKVKSGKDFEYEKKNIEWIGWNNTGN